MRIELLDFAEKDLLDGFKFYERQSEGLGDYFLDSIYYKLQKNIIQVYAVLDCRRNPAWIRNRLS